jgi:competence protein ComGC
VKVLVRGRYRYEKPASYKKSGLMGFTLLQLLVVLCVITLLGAILFPVLGRARAAAKRTQCDTRLKAIAIALNAYLQERGQYPSTLNDLVDAKYLSEPLRCPADPRQDGSYDEFYILRAPRDRANVPIVVCPFHEEMGQHGAQAFVGSYTKQFAAQPAVLERAVNATLLRPGKNPIAATSGMKLQGGDRIQTMGGGLAEIRFADKSLTEVKANSDVTVLQSFIEGQTDAPLYTLVKQRKGEVTYTVTHGSRFDVVTPTATAGALGTKFTIVIDANGTPVLTVINGKVYLSSLVRTALAPLGIVTAVLPRLPGLPNLPLLPGL